MVSSRRNGGEEATAPASGVGFGSLLRKPVVRSAIDQRLPFGGPILNTINNPPGRKWETSAAPRHSGVAYGGNIGKTGSETGLSGNFMGTYSMGVRGKLRKLDPNDPADVNGDLGSPLQWRVPPGYGQEDPTEGTGIMPGDSPTPMGAPGHMQAVLAGATKEPPTGIFQPTVDVGRPERRPTEAKAAFQQRKVNRSAYNVEPLMGGEVGKNEGPYTPPKGGMGNMAKAESWHIAPPEPQSVSPSSASPQIQEHVVFQAQQRRAQQAASAQMQVLAKNLENTTGQSLFGP